MDRRRCRNRRCGNRRCGNRRSRGMDRRRCRNRRCGGVGDSRRRGERIDRRKRGGGRIGRRGGGDGSKSGGGIDRRKRGESNRWRLLVQGAHAVPVAKHGIAFAANTCTDWPFILCQPMGNIFWPDGRVFVPPLCTETPFPPAHWTQMGRHAAVAAGIAVRPL